MHTALNNLDAEQARYRALSARLATAPLPHLEIADRRAQRDRREQLATAYAAQVREAIPTVSDELLDDWRRAAEGYSERAIVGDLTGDELAQLCDEELAGRRAHVPHIDAAARARAERNARLAVLDDLVAGFVVILGAALVSATAAGAVVVIGGIL